MAVVQLAGKLQALINPHADGFPEQLLGSNGRAELPSVLRRQADVVQSLCEREPPPVLPLGLGGEIERRACVHVRANARVHVGNARAAHTSTMRR